LEIKSKAAAPYLDVGWKYLQEIKIKSFNRKGKNV